LAYRVCPWWLGYFLVSPVRRLWQDPQTILKPFVKEGMLVLEPGCGMGFFTLEIARLVGPSGKVVAVDLQPKMIAVLKKRALRIGLSERMDARIAKADGLEVDDLAGKVDFALAFALIHELHDENRFFTELHHTLRQGRRLVVAEPKGHVSEIKFAATVESAERAGFRVTDRPVIWGSRTVVLERC